MKQKLSNDEFNAQGWYYDVITDPYQVLAEAFSHSELPHYRSMIKKMLHYAEAEKIYEAKSPGDVLFYMKIIRSLIKAADVLKEKEKGPIDVSEQNLFDKKYFRSHYQTTNDYDEFPRSLSIKEFCNPYQVFRKVFKFQPLDQWVHDWELVVESALSHCSGELGLDMLEMYISLTKLVEAAHLINVREVTHVGGILKNRFIK